MRKRQDTICVYDLNEYLKDICKHDNKLSSLWIKGEIYNCNPHSSGNLYFSLKDSRKKKESVIGCICFKSINNNIHKTIVDAYNNGWMVIINGKVEVHVPTGKYSVIVGDVEILDNGALKKREFEEALAKIKEKYTNSARARFKDVSQFPECIAVISGDNSAALEDIKRTIQRRFPIVKLKVFPAIVQGPNTKKSIIAALNSARDIVEKENQVIDTMIIARGGGSDDDLWWFNDPDIVSEIYYFNLEIAPVITGIGHEVDFTLSDYVSAARASTPTAAAELAVPDISTLKANIQDYRRVLVQSLNRQVNLEKEGLKYTKEDLQNTFLSYIRNTRQKHEAIMKNFVINKNRFLLPYHNKVSSLKSRMNFSPTKNSFNQTLNTLKSKLSYNYLSISRFNKTSLDGLKSKNNSLIRSLIEDSERRLSHQKQIINLASPLNIMKKGYTIIKQNNVLVKSIAELKISDAEVVMYDGFAEIKVIKKNSNEEK